MSNPHITLLTLDYPPRTGGVAAYLYALVRESHGRIGVLADTKDFFRSMWPRWWPMVAVCRREMKKGNIVLVSHVFPAGTAAWIARGVSGGEYAVIFHGLDIRLAKSHWKKMLLRMICRGARALVVNSESTKHDLVSLVPGVHATVITPGVEHAPYPSREEARRRLDLSSDEKLVVSVARLVPRKGIDFSLRAMSRIQTSMPVTYAVIGDGPERERLENVAAECRVKVTWIRHADDEEKRAWLAAADVFLLPVRDDDADVEGFGIVYLEAALAGIPSVAGRSGGAVEAVRNELTGLTVRPSSIDEIVAGVMRLLTDEELRLKLGETAKERALRDFRWSERWAKLAHTLGIEP